MTGRARPMLHLSLLVGLTTFLAFVSCEKAERIAVRPAPDCELPKLLGEGDDDDSLRVVVVDPDLEYTDSLAGGRIFVVPAPRPEEFITWLESAYNERDAEMFAALLADDYVCTEITPDSVGSWGREQEILIHQRMFDPNWDVKPIAGVELSLENVSAVPPPGREWSTGIWILTCDAHLVLEYVNPEDGGFEFLGPAEFHIRWNLELPSSWELVAWHDRLPQGME